MAREVRILTPHRKDCPGVEYAEDGTWPSAWWLPGEIVRADKGGRMGPHSHGRWHLVQCNIVDCDAQGIVSESLLVTAVDQALASAVKGAK